MQRTSNQIINYVGPPKNEEFQIVIRNGVKRFDSLSRLYQIS